VSGSEAKEYQNYYTFEGNFVTQFLNQFAQENKIKNLHNLLINDPKGQNHNWEEILKELLHNYEYPNYLSFRFNDLERFPKLATSSILTALS
jgi:hypothetical protein